jgi:hypothetical protein
MPLHLYYGRDSVSFTLIENLTKQYITLDT